jgi:hypothetical protein
VWSDEQAFGRVGTRSDKWAGGRECREGFGHVGRWTGVSGVRAGMHAYGRVHA